MSPITPSAGRSNAAAAPEDETLREEREVEHRLVHNSVLGIVVAVPIAVAVCVVMISLALSRDHHDWFAWDGMAAFFGTLAGAFFGVWIGFVRTTGALDDTDSHAWKAPVPRPH